ncbi:hypothetical protein jhhlp_004716, partial [Lomentospora prolificans]
RIALGSPLIQLFPLDHFMHYKQKIVIVGAGPVGSLAALYAARRGHDVEVYELRPDLRDPSTVPLNFTKSINLALSERGINAIRNAEHPKLLDSILSATIPMRGRMIHLRRSDDTLCQEAQNYDAHGRAILAMDRAGVNKSLLDAIEEMPNVKIFFGHRLTGADFRKCQAWFEVKNEAPGNDGLGRGREIQVDFDLMIGADGAHSAVRYHMMKFTRMNYSQKYIDTLWCEFQIPPRAVARKDDVMAKFAISPNHLHIWPGKEFMFIAIPSEDGSFTCTLFLPSADFSRLEMDPSSLPCFFDTYFPGVTELISPEALIKSFESNPHLPLISIKCGPHHFGSSGVIVGDAANAMVPFYGQGMNTGMESVRVLFSILDKHAESVENNNPLANPDPAAICAHQRALALSEYSAYRVPDAHAVIDLALQNYLEMRASVLSPTYRLRKFLEETISVHFPKLGWRTKYARVSFGNERFTDVVRKSDYQGKVLLRGFITALCSPMAIAGTVYLARRFRAFPRLWDSISKLVGRP